MFADALALLIRKYAPNARVTVKTNDPVLPFIDVSLSASAAQEIDVLLQAEEVQVLKR